MLATEKQKLLDKSGDYISIGITSDGVPLNVISVPWRKTVHAYNMKIPDVYISPQDLEDEALMGLLSECKVIGCYIWATLESFGFLQRFQEVRDLNIIGGSNITNLDFLIGLKKCSMLVLHDAQLENFDVILDARDYGVWNVFKCVGLYNCHVRDLSRFEKEKHNFFEFLVWNPKSKNERERWNVISADTFGYYEIKE